MKKGSSLPLTLINFEQGSKADLIHIFSQIQSDGRIRKWAKITEMNKYLRVILLEDRETIHNAFFDRSYKEDE